MRYSINIEDLLGHNTVIEYCDTLEEAEQVFISWCYCPAEIYDDFLELNVVDEEDCYIDTVDDYECSRSDREETYS
jgi:hypothetical protein